MFDLGVHRPRLFELGGLSGDGWWLLTPSPPRPRLNPVAVYGREDGRRLHTRADGSEHRVATLETAAVGMDIDWMTWNEIKEAIPPAYTRFIGEQFLSQRESSDAVDD